MGMPTIIIWFNVLSVLQSESLFSLMIPNHVCLVTIHPAIYRSKDCWFCLSSPNVESHLIISVGENCYCALAKGPLVQDHVLVIPVEHSPNTLSLPPECVIDLGRFQNSLKKYYKNQGKEVVFFEWASKRSTHANLQVKRFNKFVSNFAAHKF